MTDSRHLPRLFTTSPVASLILFFTELSVHETSTLLWLLRTWEGLLSSEQNKTGCFCFFPSKPVVIFLSGLLLPIRVQCHFGVIVLNDRFEMDGNLNVFPYPMSTKSCTRLCWRIDTIIVIFYGRNRRKEMWIFKIKLGEYLTLCSPKYSTYPE